jgi:hypothetical protein
MEDDLTKYTATSSSPSPMCANVNNVYPLTPSMNLNIHSRLVNTEFLSRSVLLHGTGERERVSLVITANL